MEGKYPIMIDDALAGTLEVTKKGAMTVFDARCRATDELLRLSVYGDDGEGYLGVMVPEGGEMRLRRSLSPLSMRGFPEEIVAAGPAGRGNAGHQGVAEEPAAPRSSGEVPAPGAAAGGKEKETAAPQAGGGETMTARVEKPEAVPPEETPEESCGIAPCEADCGEAASPTPPETGGTPGEQEGETACEKPPKRQEAETPCEEPPERQEGETPCEKPPEQPEVEMPCEKPPKWPEAEPPCKKPQEQQDPASPCEKCQEQAQADSGQNEPAAPSEAGDAPQDVEDLCWYASPDGALVCFDGVHSLIALPPKDERVPKNIPGQPRRIEGRDYLVYETKNGRIVS